MLVQVSGKPRPNITLNHAFELASYSPDAGWEFEAYPKWEGAWPEAWMYLPEPYAADGDAGLPG